MRYRKGQINTLAPSILALVFAAIVLVFGIIIASELTDTTAGKTIGVSPTNESITISGDGESGAVSGQGSCGFTSWNRTQVFNATPEEMIEGTHYSVNTANGTVFNITSSGSAWGITYTYNYGGEACEAGNETVVGLGTFADFWVIIVLAIVITIVIGLLLVIFGTGGRRR